MSKQIERLFPADSEVLLGIAEGSEQALTYLYVTYYPMVFHLILTNNGNEDDAKDIFQEAVIILYNKVRGGGFHLSSKLKTFLYAVAWRLWLKKLNLQGRTSNQIEDLHEVLSVSQDIEEHECRERQFKQMEDALSKLGEPCRTIIEDFYIKNKSMQEICSKFGYTNSGNAKNQKYKCLQRLKKYFFKLS